MSKTYEELEQDNKTMRKILTRVRFWDKRIDLWNGSDFYPELDPFVDDAEMERIQSRYPE